MERLNGAMAPAAAYPVKVLQFGEGNFLRAFVDYFIDIMNEKTDFGGSVALVKPISIGQLFPSFKEQDYRYTVVLRGLVGFLKFLDYYGLLPGFLTKLSPFHASFFITSMGSLGIPPIYHHLYNFGNVPVFLSFGARRSELVLQKDGSVQRRWFLDMKFTLDERICDGHYYAAALKCIRHYLKHPEELDKRPEQVIEDVD